MPQGLTTEQAREALARDGPNEIVPERKSPLRELARQFWAPVPWLLEITCALALATGRILDALAIGCLLIFNALLAFVQERRSRHALDLLRARIVVHAKVMRDGRWCTLPAREVVQGDAIHLSVGDIVPADLRLDDGALQVDQSVLTGESVPRECSRGDDIYTASAVRRGVASGTVIATGARTRFGKTAELVRDVRAVGSVERLIFGLVRSLSMVSVAVIILVGVAVLSMHVGLTEIALYALVVVLASVPVALPAAFTLATTLGSLALAHRGVLVTRLTAIEDAASMDVLCTDKTGTLTLNQISVARIQPAAPYTEADVLTFAAAASEASGQDPIDLAILAAAKAHGNGQSLDVERFEPFDPQTKRSRATVRQAGGSTAEVSKGAPAVLGARFEGVQALAAAGYRVIGVTLATGAQSVAVGLLGLADPPRPDAAALVRDIRSRGVTIRMLTGDGAETALHVAAQVGIPADAVDASIFPEQKVAIIQREQAAGHVVGMTGDGVNDAPSLKAANMGIAVASATDVAKAAAGAILTRPGLGDILTAIDEGRRIYQRMLTYVVAKIVKYFEIVLVTSAGFFAFGHFVLTPELMVALLILNDFVTLAIATDRVSQARGLGAWALNRLLMVAAIIAFLSASVVVTILFFGKATAHLDLSQLRGLTFLVIVATGQAVLLALRERDAIVSTPPSLWLLGAAAFSVGTASAMALGGILMPRLPLVVVAPALGAVFLWGVLLLVLKLPIYRWARISP
ncbi:MAG TPA: HAD-IC family P-type ATPase [Candidatus Tyrphobacter sp.]